MYDNSSYYLIYYICPDCNKYLLYKVKSRGIKTIFNNEIVSIFNIFTCPLCKRFYASLDSSNGANLISTKTKLSDFALRSKDYLNDEYNKLIIYTEEISNLKCRGVQTSNQIDKMKTNLENQSLEALKKAYFAIYGMDPQEKTTKDELIQILLEKFKSLNIK